MESYNNYVKIDTDALLHNYRAVAKKAGVPVMAVVKADAYGHGAVQIARLLQKECPFFGVSSLSEALELRRAGIDAPILILGHTPVSSYPQLIKGHIRPTVFSYSDALALSQEAERQGICASCHLAVDTGMSRIGFQVTEEAADECLAISRLPFLCIEGLFSHFATADCADLSRAKKQAELFDRFYDMLLQRGVQVQMRHMDNSAGIMNFNTHYDLVRSGIITYGLYPSDQVSPALLNLQPVLSWHSRIAHVKTLPAGREVGYGGAYVTTAPTKIATIPVGYADGYRRSLSGKFYVLIRGKKAPILGRICMDQMMVDVTDIPDAQEGDEVTLVGKNGTLSISVEEIAAAADSFNYEFCCGISRRVCRCYTANGKTVMVVNFLLD